jgi:putative transposase
MLDISDKSLSVRRQSRLLGIRRTKIYYIPVINNDADIANLVAEIYAKSDCRYGYRKVHSELTESGYQVNKKRVLRLMQELNFQGIYPKKKCNTTIANKEHKIYPYLLGGLEIIEVNQVWATDITYIRLQDRFMYFIAIIDIKSRYIIEYGLSHSLESEFYVFILLQALKKGKPAIFNTDQGSQFTSNDFVAILLEHEIKISMDHKGRCFDNIYVERLWRTVKQEAVYYYKPETIGELEVVLGEFVVWYNTERRHQSLDYKKPAEVYYNK